MDLRGEVLTGHEAGHTVLLRTSGGYTITIEGSELAEWSGEETPPSPRP